MRLLAINIINTKLNMTTQMYSDGIKYDNKKRNYEHNVFLYQLSDTFTPYIEVGNVAVSPTSDARQTRYRLGLQFHF